MTGAGFPVDLLAQAAQRAEAFVELAFAIAGGSLPSDHRAALADALTERLPWLADEPLAGVHALRAPQGGEGELLLPRRARLVLRLPRARVDAARELCGQRLVVAGRSLQVGASAAPRELLPTRTLHADFVCWDAAPEDFEACTTHALAALGLGSPWMSGGARQARRGEGDALHGRALLLHDLPLRHALALQVLGLGSHRLWGCGLLRPHKAVTDLGSEDD